MAQQENLGIEHLIDLIMADEVLRRMFAKIGVFIIDYKGRRVLTNGFRNESDYFDWMAYVHTWGQFLHPEDRKRVELNFRQVLEGDVDFYRDTYRIQAPDGSWRWISHRGGVIKRDEDGAPWIFVGAEEDMTLIKEAQEEASSRAREIAILNASIEVITSSLDLDETVQRILEQARRVVPYERATVQVLYDGYLEVIGGAGFSHPDLYKGLKFPYPDESSLSTRAIQERRPWMSNDLEIDFPEFIQADSKSLIKSWIGVPLFAHGDVIGFLSFDSTKKGYYNSRHLELTQAFAGPVAIALENSRLHGETYRLAMIDSLTGIGNRHAFELDSRFFFEKACRENRELSLAMLDLDMFKKVNDDFGHQLGDKTLKMVSGVCKKNLRSTDIIARYGGEEIVILFPDTNVKTAVEIAERIRKNVAKIVVEGIDRSITISIGVAGGRMDRYVLLSELIRKADDALYKAKALGRNQVVV